LKFLVDEMFPVEVAVALRERHGVDAASVRELPELRGRDDLEVFLAGQAERRAVVTENVRDFRPLAREWERAGRVHFGLVLTTNRRFPRARPRTLGHLVSVLAKLAATAGSEEASNREIWL
jgi:hypothetical protein